MIQEESLSNRPLLNDVLNRLPVAPIPRPVRTFTVLDAHLTLLANYPQNSPTCPAFMTGGEHFIKSFVAGEVTRLKSVFALARLKSDATSCDPRLVDEVCSPVKEKLDSGDLHSLGNPIAKTSISASNRDPAILSIPTTKIAKLSHTVIPGELIVDALVVVHEELVFLVTEPKYPVYLY